MSRRFGRDGDRRSGSTVLDDLNPGPTGPCPVSEALASCWLGDLLRADRECVELLRGVITAQFDAIAARTFSMVAVTSLDWRPPTSLVVNSVSSSLKPFLWYHCRFRSQSLA